MIELAIACRIDQDRSSIERAMLIPKRKLSQNYTIYPFTPIAITPAKYSVTKA